MISDPGREPMLDSPATQTVTSPSASQAGGALLRAHPAALAALYAVAATVLMTMAEQLLPASLSCYASGFLIGLKGFVAAIIGGLASYPLAAGGAILVGLLESFSSFWASAFKDVIVFTLIIPVLIWRSLTSHHVEEEE